MFKGFQPLCITRRFNAGIVRLSIASLHHRPIIRLFPLFPFACPRFRFRPRLRRLFPAFVGFRGFFFLIFVVLRAPAIAGDADFIFTGEGKIDGQSLRGKVVIGVARKAKAMGIPVIAVVGDIGDNIEPAYGEGVVGIFSTNRVAVPYKEARPRAESDMKLTMDNLLRFMKRLGA